MRSRYILILSIGVGLLLSDAARPCSLSLYRFEEKVKRADAIFVGKIISERRLKTPLEVASGHQVDTYATIDVTRVFKGNVGKTARVHYKMVVMKKNYGACSPIELSYENLVGSDIEILFYVTERKGKLVNVRTMNGGPIRSGPPKDQFEKLVDMFDGESLQSK